ncbi:hypothetical protein Hamer_G020570 [Homarus americanus]|uniref:Uncharacterized protein n=1 Tax=Homarus americanus TaxID=6706 RepID=A0A8J5K046_HOMAM|nr:hypothetical protein Hamer_G020570 [Homarus americanus]
MNRKTYILSSCIQQAGRMLARSTKALRPIDISDNVAESLSQFDRSRGNPPNLIGVVLYKEKNGAYMIGTRSGKFKGKLAHNQVEFVCFSSLKPEDVLQEHLSIR